MAKILIVEDEHIQRKHLKEFLISRKYRVDEADSANAAINMIENNYYNIILSDMKLKQGRGEEILDYVIKFSAETPVIFITAFGTIDESVKMIMKGAADYITKPVNLEELDARIGKAVHIRAVKNEMDILKKRSGTDTGIIYKSHIMNNVVKNSKKFAAASAPVLICGESGTGKELIARLIHRHSDRSGNIFTPVNSGALNENLLESELFGHEKGAFTGADKKRAGRFEISDRGTIFLDEIGDVSLAMQVKLLRVIQEGEFERVGGNKTIKTDVRIIAATNRDLKAMIKKGTFREDLFFRLNVLNIHVPPLRERLDDISALVQHYIEHYSVENGKSIRGISEEGIKKLESYAFPGNVRELQNIIQRAVILTDNKKLNKEDIILGIDNSINDDSNNNGLENAVSNLERRMIEQAMKKNRYSIRGASKALNITERQLRYKMKKYNMTEEK